MNSSIEFMADLDRRFRSISGLTDRRDYSIFYSRVQPSPVMVIGIKPGGARDGSHLLASQSLYENWEHEYVDKDYRIAAVMRPTLVSVLEARDSEELRGVPKTNTFFQRAVGTDDFTLQELRQYGELCAPFLAEIVAYIRPEAIVFEGIAARDNFVRHQCSTVTKDESATVTGMRRGRMSTFFQMEMCVVKSLGYSTDLLTLGHPSHFGHLPTWEPAVHALRANLGRSFLPTWGGPDAPRIPITATQSIEAATPKSESMPQPQSQGSGGERFKAAKRPPESFRYSPIHDFWQELSKIGPKTPTEFHQHLDRIGWNRPSGKPLTTKIVRIDLVSMVKHGFATRV